MKGKREILVRFELDGWDGVHCMWVFCLRRSFYLLLMRGGKGGWDGDEDECTINTTEGHAHGSEL
jgi:hypothetical protein